MITRFLNRLFGRTGWNSTGYTEEEFYDLPLPKQRRLLGLGEGQNPPAPSFFKAPTVCIPPKANR